MMDKFIKYTYWLFVYGLLRKASNHEMSEYLSKHADFLGTGFIQGTLYLINDYPGAVVDKSSPNKITGDIFGFEDSGLLKLLDKFEEVDISDEYLRIKVDAHLNSSTLKCHIYAYNRPTNGLAIIASGDFIKYISKAQVQ
jgi:gamma-glutamylcyclotransferase (GGCT)/AIG2-like uncharacterized protein YtfP